LTTTTAAAAAAASAASAASAAAVFPATKNKKNERKDKGFEVSRRMEGGIVVSRVDGKKVEAEGCAASLVPSAEK
jgi:hypothetical protein